MRFINKHPTLGDRRHKSSFLLFPKRIGKETRWLERATWTQEWITEWRYGHGAVPIRFQVDLWRNIMWSDDAPKIVNIS